MSNLCGEYGTNYSQQPLDLPDWPSLTSSSLTPDQPPTPSHRTKRNSSHNRPPVPKTRWKTDSTNVKPSSQSSAAPIDLSLADDETGFPNSQIPSRNSSGVSDRDKDSGTGQRGSSEKDSGVNGKIGWSKKPISVGSPEDNEEALYEYFPLSLDDWLVSHFRCWLRAVYLSLCGQIWLLMLIIKLRVGFKLYELHMNDGHNGYQRSMLTNIYRMPPVDAIYRPHVVHHTVIPDDFKAQQGKGKTKRYFSADD